MADVVSSSESLPVSLISTRKVPLWSGNIACSGLAQPAPDNAQLLHKRSGFCRELFRSSVLGRLELAASHFLEHIENSSTIASQFLPLHLRLQHITRPAARLIIAMFRSALTKSRAAEARLLRSPAHARCNPSTVTPWVVCSGGASRKALSTTTRVPAARSSQLRIPSITQRRLFTSTSSMASTRTETDAFGEVQVSSDKYWGAQTERSLENFKINQPQDRMPPPIVKAFGILKGAAATVNMKFGLGKLLQELREARW